MSGRISGVYLVVLGLALLLPGAPALAAPNLGPEWVLVGTQKVRQFVPAPPKKEKVKGKWNVKAVRDRKYFVADRLVAKAEERSLDSSKVLKEETQRSQEAHVLEKVPGGPVVRETLHDVPAGRSTASRTAGRFSKTYEIATIDQVKETVTTTPFQTYDNVSWEERPRRTLKNTYRVKTNLTFEDPITRRRLSTQAQRLEAPVEEIDLGPWRKKFERRKGGAGEEVVKERNTVGTRRTEKVLSSVLATAEGANLDGANLLSSGIAYSTGPAAGAAGSRFAANTDRLTGASRVRSAGGGKLDFKVLLRSAKAGARLVDDRGAAWALTSDGTALVFTPEGGPSARMARGLRRAEAGDVEVRLDAAEIRGGSITLSGRFKRGKDVLALTLTTL